MRGDQRTEILILYVGYFVTLAIGLIPSVSWYAVGLLVLQAFYALIRYRGSAQPTFRSHLFNYLLATGVSVALGLIITIQSQAIGFEIVKGLTLSQFSSANSLPYIVFMILIEALVAIFWPIVLICRGLYLLNTGKPVFLSFALERSVPEATAGDYSIMTQRRPQREWNMSAILPGGAVVRHRLTDATLPTVIGRNRSDANFVIDDPSVSRRHAVIEARNGEICVRDLGSTNGTFLRGRPITFNPEPLRPADELTIGSVRISISAS